MSIGFNKVIDYEDFNNPNLTPYLLDIAKIEMERFSINKPTILPDSKNWETSMALHSFNHWNQLKKGSVFAGIGAGTELLTELLANKGIVVFPIDRYLEKTPWQDVAPPGFMVDRTNYIHSKTNIQNIIPVHGDARMMDIPSNFFDCIYSSGSIEHFGGLDAIEAASSEIARILKPGGFASISTEFKLSGPAGIPWFDDSCILFTPELIQKHIIEASGLQMLDSLKSEPSSQTFLTRKELVNFLSSAKNIKSFEDKKKIYPNLVLLHEGFLFCSVHLFLQKPHDWEPVKSSVAKSEKYRNEIRKNNREAAKQLLSPHPKIPISTSPEKGQNGLLKHFMKKVNLELHRFPKLRMFLFRILFKIPKLSRYCRNLIK